MTRPSDRPRAAERALLALVAALVLLLPPLNHVWLGTGSPWYAPYLVWCALVLMGALVSRGGGHDGG